MIPFIRDSRHDETLEMESRLMMVAGGQDEGWTGAENGCSH